MQTFGIFSEKDDHDTCDFLGGGEAFVAWGSGVDQ